MTEKQDDDLIWGGDTLDALERTKDETCQNCGHDEKTCTFIECNGTGKKFLPKTIGILEMAKRIKDEDRESLKKLQEAENQGKKPEGCGRIVGWFYKYNKRTKPIKCGDKPYAGEYIELCSECSKTNMYTKQNSIPKTSLDKKSKGEVK